MVVIRLVTVIVVIRLVIAGRMAIFPKGLNSHILINIGAIDY